MPFRMFSIMALAGLALASPLPAQPLPGAVEAARDLAPSGRLKVAINLGNAVLARRDPATGALSGVSVDLARALGQALGVPVDLLAFRSAGETFDALGRGEWALGFMAVDPQRVGKIDFSTPYVAIEGTYLVRKDRSFRRIEDIDRPATRVAVARGSAYDLYLSRALKQAQLIRTATPQDAIDLFRKDNLDAVAGIRQGLAPATAQGDLTVMSGSFMRIEQAIAVPRGHAPGAAFADAFIRRAMVDGTVRAALTANGQEAGLAVRPTQH